jgi:hypothetical protein
MTIGDFINPADRIGSYTIFNGPVTDYQILTFLMKQALRGHFGEKKAYEND